MGSGGTQARWLGVELGVGGFTGVVVDADGRVVGHRTGSAPHALGTRELVASAVAFVRRIEQELAPAVGLGVGLEGQVDHAGGEVVASAHHPFLAGAPLAQLLEEALWRPCAVADRVTAVCAGEFEALGSPRGTDLVVLDVGEEITCLILREGRSLTERRGLSPDLAHLAVAAGDDLCAAGHRGCLVTRTAPSAVARRAGAADLAEVLRSAEAGESLARAALGETAEALGAAVAALVDLVVPDRIALGGPLFAGCGTGPGVGGASGGAAADALLEAVRREALRRARPAALQHTLIEPYLHGARTGAFGAACLARRAAA